MTGCTAFAVSGTGREGAGPRPPVQRELPLAGGGFGPGWYGLPLVRAAGATPAPANDAAHDAGAPRRHG